MERFCPDLNQVDRVEVVTLIDNYTDLLLGDTDIVRRPPRAKGEEIPRNTLLAEHGLSLLVSVTGGGDRHTILFDTGYSEAGVLHNIEQMELDLKMIETIVMSHAHMDHTGSLYALLERFDHPVQVAVHPEAFLFPRYVTLQDGKRLRFPRTLVRAEVEQRAGRVLETRSPTLLSGGMILVTGEVERKTSFEKGLPNALMEKNGQMVKDPVTDDQALVVLLRGKGLVVISGCSHAGIINTLFHAREITGEKKVHAVFGGFHLSGPAFEPIVEDTIRALKEIDPAVVVPMHCTGWKAINRIAEAFPSQFILNSVGSRFVLGRECQPSPLS